MLALTHLVLGLAIAHVTLLVFFFIGSAAFPWCDSPQPGGASRATMRATCTCGLGIAIAGLTVFSIGSMGWLTPAGIAVGARRRLCRGVRATAYLAVSRKFWRARFRALAACASCADGTRVRRDAGRRDAGRHS